MITSNQKYIPSDVTAPAKDLKLFTVIDGIEHYGLLKLVGQSVSDRFGKVLGDVKNTFSSNIIKLIELIPSDPTLDGDTSILNAVNEIDRVIREIGSDKSNDTNKDEIYHNADETSHDSSPQIKVNFDDDKQYNKFKELVNYVIQIIVKINLIKQSIANTKNPNNNTEYNKKYKQAFEKFATLCTNIHKLKENALRNYTSRIEVSNPADANKTNNQDNLIDNLDLIGVHALPQPASNNGKGGAKTRRKRFKRRTSTYKKPR
jgi:hypothetical protein